PGGRRAADGPGGARPLADGAPKGAGTTGKEGWLAVGAGDAAALPGGDVWPGGRGRVVASGAAASSLPLVSTLPRHPSCARPARYIAWRQDGRRRHVARRR